VLDVSLGADFETYAIAAVVCALAGFFTLVASAMMGWTTTCGGYVKGQRPAQEDKTTNVIVI
jgi:hypothetical protein